MLQIASLGTNASFVALFASQDGEETKLVATATEWCAMTGEFRKEELGEKVVSLEEAQDAASDLQGDAKEWLLNKSGTFGWFDRNQSFDSAVAAYVF